MNEPKLSPAALALEQVKIRDAAYLLKVNERTVRRLIERRELPAIGRGPLRRIRLSDIREYQERNRSDREVN
jgi:excisionase family DNA binding protein